MKLLEPLRTEHYLTAGAFNPAAALAAADPDARLTHLSRLATRFSRMASTLTFLNSSRRDRDREMFDTGSPAGKDAAAAAAVTVAVAGAGAGAAAAAAALASDGDGMAGSGVDGGREGVEGLSAVVVRPSALRIAGMEGALGGSSHSSSVSGIADGCTGGGGGGDSARGTLVGGSSFFNQSRRSNRVSASNAPLSDGEASSMTGSASAAAVAVRTGPPPFAERRSASGAVSVGAWGSFTPGTGGGSTNGMAPPAPASVDAAAAGGAIVGRASASGTVVVAAASAAAGSRPGSGMPHRSESGSLAAALLGHFRRGGVGGGSKASSSATSATAGTAAAAAAVGPTSASRFAGPPAAPSSPPPPVPHSHSAVVDLRDNALFGDSTYSAATATPPLTPLGVAAPDAAKAALVAPHVVQTDSLLLQSGADYAAAAVLGSPTPTATAGATDVASAAAASAFMSAAAVTAASAAAAGEVDGARRSALSARPQSGRTSSNGASPVPAHAAPLLPAVITAAPVAPRVEPLGMSMPSISRRLSRAGGSSLSGAVPAAPTAGMPISSARLPSALIPEDASQDSSGATAGNAADAADPAIRDVPLPDPASQPNGPDAGPHAVRSALAGSMAAFAAALESHDSFTHASHRSPTRLSGGGGSGWHGSPRLPGAMVGSPSASHDAARHSQLEQKRRRRKSLIMADGGAALPHDSIGSPRQLSDDEGEALTEAANAAAATLISRKSGGGGGGAGHITGGRSRLGAVEMTGGGPGALHMPAPPEAPLPPAPAPPPPAAPVPAGTAGVAAASEPPPQSAAARMVAAAKALAEEFAAMEHARAQKLAQQQQEQQPQEQQQQQAPPAPPSRRTSLSGADASNGSQGGGILAAGSSALSRKSPRRTTIDGAAASSDRQMSGRPLSGRPPSGRPPSGRPNASGAAGPGRLPSAAQRNSNSISRRDSGLKGSGGAADDAVAAAAAGLGAEPSATDTAAGGGAASGFMAAGNAIVASDRLARGRPTSARASDSGLVPAPATVASPGAVVAEPASLQPAASLRRTGSGSSGRAGRTAMTAAVHAVGATTKLTAASAATAATAAAHAAAAAATAAPATAAAPAVGSTHYAASGGSTSLSSTASPSSPQSTHHYQSPPLPAAIDEKDSRAAAAAWPASVPSAMPPPAIRVPSSSGDKAEMQRAAAAAAAAATANGVASGGAAKAPTVVIGSPAGVAALSTRDSVGAAKLGSPAGQEPVLPIELQIRRVEVYERYGQLFEEFRGGKIAAATFQVSTWSSGHMHGSASSGTRRLGCQKHVSLRVAAVYRSLTCNNESALLDAIKSTTRSLSRTKYATSATQGALLANAIVPAVLLAVQAGADMAAGSRGAKATNIALLCVKALFAIYMSAVLPFSNAITMTAEVSA